MSQLFTHHSLHYPGLEWVLLAYVLAGLTRWGRHLLGQKPTWGEVRQEWGWSLIPMALEVQGWLTTLGRLLLSALTLLSPIAVPKPLTETL